MKTVLLAWELGAGFGHVTSLRRIALRLAARGFRCVAAVKDVGTAAVLASDGFEVLQAPVWNKAKSSVTLGDTLGDAALADPWTLRQLLQGWRRIVAETKPDLVISDYAPAAGLVARGHIPLAVVGNGYTLPPAEMATFPLLHGRAPPTWHEQFLLDMTNSVLADFKLQLLQRLPQLFAGDAAWVHTLPLLDPYAAWRKVPAQGPTMDGVPKPRAAGASEILVYLSSWDGAQRPFLQALRRFAHNVRLVAPGYSRAELADAAAMGMRVEAKRFDLAEDLASAKLVVHLGSEGTATSCVLAGAPQLACGIDMEKLLIGMALTKAGIGKLVPIYDRSVTLTEEMVGALLADQAVVERAREVGEAHRSKYRDAEPLGGFVEECVKLLA
jgi:UDP:flavonoid glycosyltransferase YjiC (YdhE family)